MKYDLRPEFERLVKEFLAAHEGIRHEWRQVRSPWVGDRMDLTVAPASADGFEVWASASEGTITVGTVGGLHYDFEDYEINPGIGDATHNALDELVELLGNDVRVREYRCAGRGYGWQLEYERDGVWEAGRVQHALAHGWFGEKTEHVLMNNWLPPEPAAACESA